MRARILIVGTLCICCSEQPPASTGSPAAEKGDSAESVALRRAEDAAKKLGGTLKRALLRTLAEGTPADALGMCASQAQPMTAGVADQAGVKVGRSSLRLRNPKNAAPAWVQAWLEQQGEREASGVEGFSRVDVTPQGKVARFVAPIVIEGPCLNCHGPAASLSTEVSAALAERYPQDKAVGYAAGQLRGALWAEAPVGT